MELFGTMKADVEGRRILLHVGLPKTGTSALQHWFRHNAPLLGSAGVCYPMGEYLTGDKHQFLVHELRRGGNMLERLLPQIHHPTIVLSSEGLSNHFYDFSETALRAFREQTAGFQVDLILVERESNAWLKSYHKQCVINPNNGASELWATPLTCLELAEHPRVRQLMDIPRLVEDLLKGFGARRLYLMKFEEDWFHATLDILSLCERISSPPRRVNESIPEWAVEVLRRLNASGVPEGRRVYWKHGLADFLQSAHMELTSRSSSGFADIDALEKDILVLQEALEDREGLDKGVVTDFLCYLRARARPEPASVPD